MVGGNCLVWYNSMKRQRNRFLVVVPSYRLVWYNRERKIPVITYIHGVFHAKKQVTCMIFNSQTILFQKIFIKSVDSSISWKVDVPKRMSIDEYCFSDNIRQRTAPFEANFALSAACASRLNPRHYIILNIQTTEP